MQTTFGTIAQLEHVQHKLPPKYDDCRQQFSSYWSNEEEILAKTLFQAQSSIYLSEKKLLLFTLQMNDIYWKRRTMTVSFQRMFRILERWNNNQDKPSLSKPHELSYRSNIKNAIKKYHVFIFYLGKWTIYVKTINTKKFLFFVRNVMVFFWNHFLYFVHLCNRDVTFKLFRALRPLLHRGLQSISYFVWPKDGLKKYLIGCRIFHRTFQ